MNWDYLLCLALGGLIGWVLTERRRVKREVGHPHAGLQEAKRPPPTPKALVRPPSKGLPYRAPPAPPPAHIAEHSRECPIYQEWERSMCCDHCGNRLSEKPPKRTGRPE